MKHLNLARSFLFACALVPACGDDKGTSDGSTSNGTMTDAGTDSQSPTTNGPTTTPTSTDPTTDPTAGGGMFCQEQCAQDGDCTLNGVDAGYTCKDGRCAGGCADDNACVQMFSGWVTACTDQAGCPGQVCIDIGGGEGRCALAPSDVVMCETFMFNEAMFPPIEGGAPVTVCANTDYTCTNGTCSNPCESDSECVVPGYTQCNLDTGACSCADDAGCMAVSPNSPKCTATGFCGCADDTNCAGTPNTPICTDSGFCGCSEDANCVAAMTGDTCYNGTCGCSDTTACPATTIFGGTKFVCEGF